MLLYTGTGMHMYKAESERFGKIVSEFLRSRRGLTAMFGAA